jgi:hypothetical protein
MNGTERKSLYEGMKGKNKEMAQQILMEPKAPSELSDMHLQDIQDSLFHFRHEQSHVLLLVYIALCSRRLDLCYQASPRHNETLI